jgi:putative ATP-dependent endonuclease of the OLD family
LKIRHLSINNFRGVRELDWGISQSMVCLIGRGDTTKSTILDAIHLALSPSWSLQFTDADFHNCETANPIEIVVTVGELPETLLSRDKFGDHFRGWSIENGLIDEPEEGTEIVLSVALRVDETLEPKWFVINDREPEGIQISATDRRRLGVTWLGTYVDQQLSWGKYSALSRLTGDEDELATVLADASRRAREAVASATLNELKKSAERASEAAGAFGVHPKNQYNVGLDAKLSVTGQSTLTLHDGQVPARLSGLGSRRLLTLAIQHQGVPEGGIMLIDEIEVGLEPHRLRHLIRKLRPDAKAIQQVFLTTHSSVAIEELLACELNIVHNDNGKVDITLTKNDLQGLLRKTPEAFLATKIIACEGSTEVGFVRKLDMFWQSEEGGGLNPFAFLGVAPITSSKGGGSDMSLASIRFRELGFDVAFLGDSDVPLNPSEKEMDDAGVKIIQWVRKTSIEDRICLDLPFDGLDDFIVGAVECEKEIGNSAQGVYDSIGSGLGLDSGQFDGRVETLVNQGKSEDEIRTAIGQKAKDKGWYKRVSGGECLAQVIIQYRDAIPETDVMMKISALREWTNE